MNIFGFEIKRAKKKKQPEKHIPQVTKDNVKSIVPVNGRVSDPPTNDGTVFELMKKLTFIKPSFMFEAIPAIRRLYKINGDVGSVLHDLMQLTNTGHTIEFEQSVDANLQDKMREHLRVVSKNWGAGTAGIDGLINKFVAQLYVSGALSVESIVRPDLTGIKSIALVNPESIRFALQGDEYIAYQKVNRLHGVGQDHIKLNPHTYKYFGIFSDEDTPYGIPPFMAALEDISMQKDMKVNIKHILNQMGLLGYLEVKLDKPMQKSNEREHDYLSRLTALLTQTKNNVLKGFKDGVVVGYQEDHEFEFHSTTKNLNGVQQLFNLNENQIANGLKTSANFLGVTDGGSEGFTSIVFTKMLSQLKNIQEILSEYLESVYKLELALAGYDYKSLRVEFKPSTITDDLKIQQALEVKQRVLHNLWVDRIISADIYAEALGYIRPYKIIEPPLPSAAPSKQKEREDREKGKDASDRRVREKNKPQPKRKDHNNNFKIV